VLVIPAIDILGGRCVRLVQGDYERATDYSDDPVAVAKAHVAAGARRLHVVDLDAARGTGDNHGVVERLLASVKVEVQVAGGIRTEKRVDGWLALGASHVVMGTAAVRQPEVLAACVQAHPGQVLAALDVKEGRPAVSGWAATEALELDGLLAAWRRLDLGGVALTCVDRDGTLEGPDLEALASVRQGSVAPVLYGGGVSSIADIEAVAAAGAAGVILGKALYEGRIDLGAALELST
jgi:phosphoribosylformimino-5-aminoimidazole carboxamide ribotide isomerase